VDGIANPSSCVAPRFPHFSPLPSPRRLPHHRIDAASNSPTPPGGPRTRTPAPRFPCPDIKIVLNVFQSSALPILRPGFAGNPQHHPRRTPPRIDIPTRARQAARIHNALHQATRRRHVPPAPFWPLPASATALPPHHHPVPLCHIRWSDLNRHPLSCAVPSSPNRSGREGFASCRAHARGPLHNPRFERIHRIVQPARCS